MTTPAKEFYSGFLAATGLTEVQADACWTDYFKGVKYPDFDSGYEAGIDYLADQEEREQADLDAEFERQLRAVGWDVIK